MAFWHHERVDGAEHMAIDSLFLDSDSESSSCHGGTATARRLLARFHRFPPLPQNSRKAYPKLTTTQLPTIRRQVVSRNPTTWYQGSIHCNLSSDPPYHTRCPTLVGTVWSLRKPEALRSSPADPRSWQAPLTCPGQALGTTSLGCIELALCRCAGCAGVMWKTGEADEMRKVKAICW